MVNITACFDIDGTLINLEDDSPRPEIIDILKSFVDSGYVDVFVWSGGGLPYAEMWGRRLGLPAEVQYARKASFYPDVAFDDEEEFILAKVVVHVGLPLESS